MVSPRVSVRTDLRSSMRRRCIVDAAVRLFATARYDAVQIDDVARAAGVAKPTLYRYFATKEELFIEAADLPLGEVVDELAIIAETRSEARQALPAMMHILLDRLDGHDAGVRVLDGSEKRFGRHARARLYALAKQIRGSLAAVLRRGIYLEEFRDIDADLVAVAIIGSLRMVATKVPSHRRATAAQAITNILISGIASHAAEETSAPPMQAVAEFEPLGVD